MNSPREAYEPETAVPHGTGTSYREPIHPSEQGYTPRASYPSKRAYREDSRHKSPALATFLSLMPGLGQIYVGYYLQGFINVLVIGSLITMIQHGMGVFEPMCGFFLAFFWLYNLVDAYRRALGYNLALEGLGPMEFPEPAHLPAGQGSLLGGSLLILLGVLLLSNTLLDFSLRWVEEWWPAALVGLGGWLIYKSISDKRSEKATENRT